MSSELPMPKRREFTKESPLPLKRKKAQRNMQDFFSNTPLHQVNRPMLHNITDCVIRPTGLLVVGFLALYCIKLFWGIFKI